MIRLVKTLDSWVSKVETAALVATLAIMALLAVVQVTLKLLPGNQGSESLEMFVRYLVVWVGFLGGAVAAYQARHINIDVVTRFIGPTTGRVVGTVVNLTAAVLAALLVRISLQYLDMRLEDKATAFTLHRASGDVDVPEWWFVLVVPAGLALMSWHFLAQAIYRIGGVEGDGGAAPDAGGRP